MEKEKASEQRREHHMEKEKKHDGHGTRALLLRATRHETTEREREATSSDQGQE